VIDVCDEIASLFRIGIRFATFTHPEANHDLFVGQADELLIAVR